MTAVGWAQSVPGSDDSRRGIPFEVNRQFGAILIHAQINGRPAILLVDTGSSHTILSSELLLVRPLALRHTDGASKGSGYVGTRTWAKARLEVGAFTWLDRKVLVMNDFRDISRSMHQTVDGILGVDILEEFDSVAIDFNSHRLFIMRREYTRRCS
jgi:gag-polyprotein putative aspartyl protease